MAANPGDDLLDEPLAAPALQLASAFIEDTCHLTGDIARHPALGGDIAQRTGPLAQQITRRGSRFVDRIADLPDNLLALFHALRLQPLQLFACLAGRLASLLLQISRPGAGFAHLCSCRIGQRRRRRLGSIDLLFGAIG